MAVALEREAVGSLPPILAEATNAQIELVTATRENTQAARDAATEADAAAAALTGQAGQYKDLARRAMEAAKAQAEFVRNTITVQDIAELATSGVNHLENAFVEFSQTGQASIKDLANAVLADLTRIVVRAQITANILRALGIGQGGALTGDGLLGFLAPSTAHEGGVVGNLQRYARKVLRPNERVVVTELGEEVITRGDPRHRYNLDKSMLAALRGLPRHHEGGVVGADGRVRGGTDTGQAMSVQVELINRSASPIQATRAESRFDIRGMVISVVLDDIRRNGPIAQANRLSLRAT